MSFSRSQHTTWYAEEGASISIKGLQADGGTAVVFCAVAQSQVSGGVAPAAEPWALAIFDWLKGVE